MNDSCLLPSGNDSSLVVSQIVLQLSITCTLNVVESATVYTALIIAMVIVIKIKKINCQLFINHEHQA